MRMCKHGGGDQRPEMSIKDIKKEKWNVPSFTKGSKFCF